jgi:hypothetical protein
LIYILALLVFASLFLVTLSALLTDSTAYCSCEMRIKEWRASV